MRTHRTSEALHISYSNSRIERSRADLDLGGLIGAGAWRGPLGRGETVLLVEDEHSLWQLTSRILARNGYQVAAAVTAVDAVRRARDLQQPCDLLDDGNGNGNGAGGQSP